MLKFFEIRSTHRMLERLEQIPQALVVTRSTSSMVLAAWWPYPSCVHGQRKVRTTFSLLVRVKAGGCHPLGVPRSG